MAVPILFELNQELTRLFVAGSRLAAGDPRIKKFITPLQKYGEKSPVFLRLAQHIEELLEVEASLSAQKLIETEIFLLSVLSTQGDTMPEGDTTNIDYAQEKIGETNISYRTLSPVIDALTKTGSGRMEVVEQAFKSGVFSDARIFEPAIAALGDKYGEIADYMASTVLPSMGETIFPYLTEGYDLKGGVVDGRRLAVMHAIKGEAILDLVEETVKDGNALMRAEAVKIMGNYPKYETLLLGMLDEVKSVHQEVMKALVKMNSKEGIDKLIELYNGDKKKYETVLSALSYGTSGYLTDELLKCAYADYSALKNEIDSMPKKSKDKDKEESLVWEKRKRLFDDITTLSNKQTDEAAQFLKMILSEAYLTQSEKVVPQAKKVGYYYQRLDDCALAALYQSGKGDEFIWEMFTDIQSGVKSVKNSDIPKMLNNYAFSIGAKRLNPEEFYDTFFKNDLFKDISKNDYYAFQNVFLKGENRPEYSPRIVSYLVQKGNANFVYLATQIVKNDDSYTIHLLAKHLRENLGKNSSNYYNYEILKRLGETGHKDFKELYELFCSKKHYNNAGDMQYLEQFLDKE